MKECPECIYSTCDFDDVYWCAWMCCEPVPCEDCIFDCKDYRIYDTQSSACPLNDEWVEVTT